ncbi:MAG: hypothetical protein BGO41_09180 [Clostridiales bacterium 38-18]|nr:MAG: hypothetical protein BGO41_09180 [Clostridiales bacterium 38-18]
MKAQPNYIQSNQNKLFKKFKSLNTKKYRELENAYLLEGERYVLTALENRHSFIGIIVEQKYWIMLADKLQSFYLDKTDVYVMPTELFVEIVQTEQSQGIVGVIERVRHLTIEEINQNDLMHNFADEQFIWLDRIQDPGNLGTIIRTADASGFRHIILGKGTVDPYNSKVVRSTAGSLMNVKFIDASDEIALVNFLKSKSVNFVVTALENSSNYMSDDNYRALNCLVIGNEANGVSDYLLSQADARVIIPIYGGAESLNAAVAAGIMMYRIDMFLKK